jgi:hypothetical protein
LDKQIEHASAFGRRRCGLICESLQSSAHRLRGIHRNRGLQGLLTLLLLQLTRLPEHKTDTGSNKKEAKDCIFLIHLSL